MTHRAGSSDRGELWAAAAKLSLTELLLLKSRLEQKDTTLKFIDKPISFEQLELLEAELQNQGILPRPARDVRMLTQQSAREAAVWSWRAERFGFAGRRLAFRLQLPQYVLEQAEELLALLQGRREPHSGRLRSAAYRSRTDSTADIRSALSYLDAFAGYLLGKYDSAENGYQRGLNLILKVISERDSGGTYAAEERDEPCVVDLPLNTQSFLSSLRESKESIR